jgi:sulfotransferase family protein
MATRNDETHALLSLPNVVVIGAMKCGTSALHRYLDLHPDVAMSEPKELNFFFECDEPSRDAWHPGNWHRGPEWYARHWSADSPVRGESSPGYTSPAHTRVAERMAALIPGAKLVYLVRDPVDRALSQYRHHCADGAEVRPPDEALLDLTSQYILRGRYFDRLRPFLETFAREQILIVSREELLTKRRASLQLLFGFVGVDDFWSSDYERLWHTSRGDHTPVCENLRTRLAKAFVDDAERLRELAGREFPGWSV